MEGEEMFFFPGIGGQRLLGFLHSPLRSGSASSDDGARAGKPGILYCHPFGEERNLSHATVVKTARALAAAGFPVLRFDFSGCGDSEGDLERATVESWLAEIGLAADLLKERTGVTKVGYWGLRSGANLAWHAAFARGDSGFSILWNPVPGLKTFITQFLRQKSATAIAAGGGEGVSVKGLVKELETGGTVEVMGYPVTQGLYAGFLRADLQGLPGKLPGPALFLTVGETDEAPGSLASLADTLRANGNAVDSEHVRETPFWDRYWRWEAPALTGKTLAWTAGLD
jgi:exosortase A-associated hydrolase 2